MPNKRLTTNEFVKRAVKIHGNKYDYFRIEYLSSRLKVKIICKEHGEFEQTPNSHLAGKGCSKCAGNCNLITEEFVMQANKVHKNKYDYSKTKYKNSHIKIIIICKEHGEFKQYPYNHLQGRGCLKCCIKNNSLKKIKVKKQFITDAINIHGNKYDYGKVEYIKSDSKVKIICKEHGEFEQTPNSHLSGQGCRRCGYEVARLKNTSSKDDFIKKAKKIHGDRYSYDKVEYKNGCIKVKIKCKYHGYFLQTPFIHLAHAGCPYCFNKNEGEVKNLLLKYFKDWVITRNKKIWDKYKDYHHRRYCDFWIEKENIKVIVEYDGRQHFMPVCFNGISIKKAEKEFKKTQIKDDLDKEFCDENNIILYRIRYDEDKEKSIKRLKYLLEGQK